LKSGNVCYHSGQNLLSSSLISKNIKITIYKTIILHVVWYGYKTWSLTLREERRLMLFENMVLRKIFGPKRDKVKREWTKLQIEEHKDLYLLPSIVLVIKWRRMIFFGHVARMREKIGVYRFLVEKPKGKRPLGSPKCRWEDNIKMNLQEMLRGGIDWIDLVQALVNAIINFRVP